MQKAELIKCRRTESIINDEFGFLDRSKGQESFLDYFKQCMNKTTNKTNWLASTLGRFNANELRRADHEVHDIADGRYDGRIQKYQQGLTR